MVYRSISLSVGRSVGRSVNLLVCVFVSPHVFSRTVAAVDTKRGYVGMCNVRSAQQESGAALSSLRRGPKIIILGVQRSPTDCMGWLCTSSGDRSNVHLESKPSDI